VVLARVVLAGKEFMETQVEFMREELESLATMEVEVEELVDL